MKKFRTFFFTCGILMAASEIWKQLTLTFLINHGAYDWWYFPFQLCSIPMYICLILPVISKPKISTPASDTSHFSDGLLSSGRNIRIL